jgi:hypothetical protein
VVILIIQKSLAVTICSQQILLQRKSACLFSLVYVWLTHLPLRCYKHKRQPTCNITLTKLMNGGSCKKGCCAIVQSLPFQSVLYTFISGSKITVPLSNHLCTLHTGVFPYLLYISRIPNIDNHDITNGHASKHN